MKQERQDQALNGFQKVNRHAGAPQLWRSGGWTTLLRPRVSFPGQQHAANGDKVEYATYRYCH